MIESGSAHRAMRNRTHVKATLEMPSAGDSGSPLISAGDIAKAPNAGRDPWRASRHHSRQAWTVNAVATAMPAPRGPPVDQGPHDDELHQQGGRGDRGDVPAVSDHQQCVCQGTERHQHDECPRKSHHGRPATYAITLSVQQVQKFATTQQHRHGQREVEHRCGGEQSPHDPTHSKGCLA